MSTSAEGTSDPANVRPRQYPTWAIGNYSRIGSLLQISGERLVEAMDPAPGSRFLDVVAGNGNLTLAAARRYCRVTSTDRGEASLAGGRARASANGLNVTFRSAEAAALPFADGDFDCVGSAFGVMFTPDPGRAAGELLRVCRSGGKIGLASWTPEGFFGSLLERLGRLASPPDRPAAATRWGTELFLRGAFGSEAESIDLRRREVVFRLRSAEHLFEVLARRYGPLVAILEAQPPEQRILLTAGLLDLFDAWNSATDGTLRIDSEYLEAVITRR